MRIAVLFCLMILSMQALAGNAQADELSPRDVSIVNQILASPGRDCVRANAFIHSLHAVKIESLVNYQAFSYLVTGVSASGQEVEISLMMRSDFNPGSFGGGGYYTYYGCSVE